jgi:hypothetical protein
MSLALPRWTRAAKIAGDKAASEDRLAEDAVCGEPVSAGDSLIGRETTGNFAKSRDFPRAWVLQRAEMAPSFRKFPGQSIREFFSSEQGIDTPEQEISSDD